MKIRIASYNIQYGYGQDGRYDLARSQAALAGQDIICLQEVTTGLPICNSDDQPKAFAETLNMFGVYAAGFEGSPHGYGPDGRADNRRMRFGNMVLSRWPIVYSRQHSLPRPATDIPDEIQPKVDFPRTALETVIDADGTALRVICVHLTHLPGAQRLEQAQAIRQLVETLPAELPLWLDDPRLAPLTGGNPPPPVPKSSLVLGDFNFRPDEPDYACMLESAGAGSALIDGGAAAEDSGADGHTCLDSDGTRSRIDYMFATADMAGSVRSAIVDRTITASDHYPIYFRLEF